MSHRSVTKHRPLRFESMEERRCMAANAGWDGAGQGSAALTYYIGNTPASLGLDRATIEAALETALSAWSAVAAITFTQTSQPNRTRSIDFSFRSLDGAGGTLAQAYFPANRSAIAGDVQFDVAERWEVGNTRAAAFDLVYVAVHEIGHALGLDHSSAAGSVMAASASGNRQFAALAANDISSIRSLYAATAGTTTSTPTTTTTHTTTPTTTINPPVTPSPSGPRVFWWHFPWSSWRRARAVESDVAPDTRTAAETSPSKPAAGESLAFHVPVFEPDGDWLPTRQALRGGARFGASGGLVA